MFFPIDVSGGVKMQKKWRFENVIAGDALSRTITEAGNSPLSFDAQVDQLIERGIEIDDRERAKRYLAHLNYYRLAAYWLPFEEDRLAGRKLWSRSPRLNE